MFAPALANPIAMPRPSPPLPPVTIATLPVKSNSSRFTDHPPYPLSCPSPSSRGRAGRLLRCDWPRLMPSQGGRGWRYCLKALQDHTKASHARQLDPLRGLCYDRGTCRLVPRYTAPPHGRAACGRAEGEVLCVPHQRMAFSTITPQDLEILQAIERRVLWLSTYMIHHANKIRPNPDGLKVGGHQASSCLGGEPRHGAVLPLLAPPRPCRL